MLTGRRQSFDIQSVFTVDGLKEAIQGTEGIPIDQQRLIFHGAQLADSCCHGIVL
jgi:hypothetical protein